MTIEYLENTEEAIRIARVALPLASKFQVPANPVSYAVLYEHVGGQNPGLSNAINEIQKNAEQITHEEIKMLYQNYISQPDEKALDQFRVALGGIMGAASGSLEKINGESQSYHLHLDAAAQELSDRPVTKEVETLVSDLIKETRSIQSASQELRSELDSANKELAVLKQEFERVRTQSLVDPLTGAQNRRGFDVAIDELSSVAQENDTVLSLLMIDIDHFKAINDTHGHIAGDSVLKWVAKVINKNIRGSDILCRYGGEEFTVLLPATSSIGAMRVAENIRLLMGEKPIRHNSKLIGAVTCSVGVAAFEAGETAEAFIAKADEAMYRAKGTGRNRVCVYSGLSH